MLSRTLTHKKKFKLGDFARHTLILMIGTTISQAIPVLASPLLTRIYSPEDFGLFTLFLSLTSICSIIATARYELAIMLPEKDEDALHVGALSMFILLVVSILLLAATWLLNPLIASWLDVKGISGWLYWIPLSVLLTGSYQILNYWTNRKRQYTRMALNRITQSSTTIGSNIVMGISKIGAGGLIFGGLIGQVLTTGRLGYQVAKEESRNIARLSVRSMKEQGKRFIDFPKYLIAAHVINSAASNMPVILFTSFFGGEMVGYFSLAFRSLSVPASIIAKAVGDVFRERASKEFERSGNCRAIYIKTLITLVSISIIPFLVFYFSAPTFFAFVFGEQWRLAGKFAQILLLMTFLQFTVNPLGSMSTIARKQKYDLFWQASLLVTTTGSILIGYYVSGRIETCMYMYMASYSFMYVIDLIMTYRFAANKKELETR